MFTLRFKDKSITLMLVFCTKCHYSVVSRTSYETIPLASLKPPESESNYPTSPPSKTLIKGRYWFLPSVWVTPPGLTIIRMEDTCFRKGSCDTHQRMAALLQSLVLLRPPGKFESNLPLEAFLYVDIYTSLHVSIQYIQILKLCGIHVDAFDLHLNFGRCRVGI